MWYDEKPFEEEAEYVAVVLMLFNILLILFYLSKVFFFNDNHSKLLYGFVVTSLCCLVTIFFHIAYYYIWVGYLPLTIIVDICVGFQSLFYALVVMFEKVKMLDRTEFVPKSLHQYYFKVTLALHLTTVTPLYLFHSPWKTVIRAWYEYSYPFWWFYLLSLDAYLNYKLIQAVSDKARRNHLIMTKPWQKSLYRNSKARQLQSIYSLSIYLVSIVLLMDILGLVAAVLAIGFIENPRTVEALFAIATAQTVFHLNSNCWLLEMVKKFFFKLSFREPIADAEKTTLPDTVVVDS